MGPPLAQQGITVKIFSAWHAPGAGRCRKSAKEPPPSGQPPPGSIDVYKRQLYIMDQVGDPTGDGDWLEEIAVKQAIQNLSPREKKILSLRFLDGKTQMEVAGRIGISQAQVSRLEKGALNKIKEELR